MTDDDLVHLKAFPHLRCVELPNKSRITDAGLAHLAALDELEELDLNGTGVSADGVVRFGTAGPGCGVWISRTCRFATTTWRS